MGWKGRPVNGDQRSAKSNKSNGFPWNAEIVDLRRTDPPRRGHDQAVARQLGSEPAAHEVAVLRLAEEGVQRAPRGPVPASAGCAA